MINRIVEDLTLYLYLWGCIVQRPGDRKPDDLKSVSATGRERAMAAVFSAQQHTKGH